MSSDTLTVPVSLPSHNFLNADQTILTSSQVKAGFSMVLIQNHAKKSSTYVYQQVSIRTSRIDKCKSSADIQLDENVLFSFNSICDVLGEGRTSLTHALMENWFPSEL